MHTLWQDVLFGLRMLAKKPSFTCVAVITLALGIGANTAIFSIVNGVLLRRLPYPEPERVVRLFSTPTNNPGLTIPVSMPNFRDWQAQNQVFEHLGLYWETRFNLTGTQEPERIATTTVTANVFPLLGVKPVLGRYFLPEEERASANKVAILSHGFWQRRFGSDVGIIGKTIKLDDESYEVVGVMPRDFGFPSPETELWVPLRLDQQIEDRLAFTLWAIGRLKLGVKLEQARVEMGTIARRLEQQYPATNAQWGVSIIPLYENLVGDIRRLLLLLLGAVGFVLLIACTNVANLLLARASVRQKEVAVRQALGASRFRLMRQFLTESVLLSLLGGAVGLLLSLWVTEGLLALSPTDIPRRAEIGLDSRVLLFTVVISIVTGLVFGLAPAWQITKTNINEWLKESGKTALGGLRRHRLHSVLIVSEVALALVLLIGAGLTLRSFVQLYRVEPGFKTDHLLMANVALPLKKYAQPQQRVAFYQQTIDRIAALPGVQAVSITSEPPLTGFGDMRPFYIEGRPHASPRDYTYARIRSASPGYMGTMKIPIVQGRDFTPQDKSTEPRVALINEALARTFFPGENPIGKRIKLYPGPEPQTAFCTIVGIVKDIRFIGPDTEPQPEWYRPHGQTASAEMSLVIRTQQEPLNLVAAVKREVRAVDADQPIANIKTMEQLLSDSLRWWRFLMSLLGIFGALALMLAVVGIYGVMSYFVTQRTHEIGIRLALGAQASDVLKLVVGQGMTLALIGVVVGLAGAFGLTRLMKNLLFGVSATDPTTFVVIALLLGVVALLACYLPARRATKVDPMIALRYE